MTEFAWVTANADRAYFRLVPPHSRQRMRLGFGNTGTDFKANIDRIRRAADEDPRFALAMALLADAAHEPNPLFKICRLFNVLESLAYALKGDRTGEGDKVGSRKAVKIMMGLEGDASANVHVDEHSISYDRIEISGRLRDKFFHGIPFSKADLNEEAQPAFHLIEHHPEIIADALQADCEIAIARWANDASPARDAARKKASGK